MNNITFILILLCFYGICYYLNMLLKIYIDDKNYITENEWTNFHRTLNYMYIQEGMEHYGSFYTKKSFNLVKNGEMHLTNFYVKIGEMAIYLKKYKYSFKDYFLKHKSNIYYTVHYMPYGSFTTDIFKTAPEEMMFELYTDFDVLIAEFPRLIRDRKKIYKKHLIESIYKEKDIC